MLKFDEHPTVLKVRGRVELPTRPVGLDAGWLKQLCLECGADDVGFVSLERPEVISEVEDVRKCFPAAKTLISFVCRMNREPIRALARSVANAEFHHTTDMVNEIANAIVRKLEDAGIRAMNPPAGFPMEMSQFPGKVWVVSHKTVAVAAGMGRMGIHRNVIHPRFGNFILLGTILLGAEVSAQSYPIDYNPCLECKLCVAACPVGAIKPDGQFDFSACMNHNYREFMSGFTDWVEQVADSKNAKDYRHRVTDQETASMWQSLSFGANYKAAYCLAVCPAGEDVISPFLQNRAQFVAETVKPLQQKVEPIYVVPGSDAEEYVARKYPHKLLRRIAGIRVSNIKGFLRGLHLVFQPGQAKGLNAVYHFTFTGDESAQATVSIQNEKIRVEDGHVGSPTCSITVKSATWLGFLRKEKNIVWAIITRKVRVKGGIKWLKAFGKCFPS